MSAAQLVPHPQRGRTALRYYRVSLVQQCHVPLVDIKVGHGRGFYVLQRAFPDKLGQHLAPLPQPGDQRRIQRQILPPAADRPGKVNPFHALLLLSPVQGARLGPQAKPSSGRFSAGFARVRRFAPGLRPQPPLCTNPSIYPPHRLTAPPGWAPHFCHPGSARCSSGGPPSAGAGSRD